MTQDNITKYTKQLERLQTRQGRYQDELQNTYAASKRGKLLRQRLKDIRTEISIVEHYLYLANEPHGD